MAAQEAQLITVLFWNLARNAATLPHLECLAKSHDVDVFLLAEAPKDLNLGLTKLNALGAGLYQEPAFPRPKVRVLTRMASSDFKAVFTGDARDMTIWAARSTKLPAGEVLLAVVHLPSKMGGNTSENQLILAGHVSREIVEQENDRRHQNTIVVGDFNMNPFDAGMTHVTGFHGHMTRALAERRDRDHRGNRYRRFYNPMWGHFGDQTSGPAGTYYWDSSVPSNHYWSIFDQVLIRPAMIDYLTGLEILDHDKVHPLTRANKIPYKKHLSDHLPIIFKIDI